MNIKDLNDNWIVAGQKVSDLNAEVNKMIVDDSVTEEEFKAKSAQLNAAVAKRDVAYNQYVNAKAADVLETNIDKDLNKKEKDLSAQFVSDFKAMVTGDPSIKAKLSSELDINGDGVGLTIPEDVKTAINTLRRQYDSLEHYVKVEKTVVPSGSRVYEKWSDITPLNEMDAEDGVIPSNDDPTLTLIKYLIKRYAGITTLTNTLLKDSAENIIAWIVTWITRKSVVTRNKKILEKINSVSDTQKVTVKNIDGIKDIVNVTIDPAIATTSMFVTNQSGYNVLDKVKSSDGSFLLQKDVTSATGYSLLNKPIKVIGDRWMPNGGTTNKPLFPLVIGDLKEAITLFDREQLSLKTTDVGAGAFETDTTKIRVIDRFDVTLTDEEAIVVATFEGIADETPVTP